MIYLNELIVSHRKILRAGALIGDKKGGICAALGLFVAAIGYARAHLTDGLVPDEYLAEVSRDRLLIAALADARLIVRERNKRWRIHDYLKWNPTAEQVRQRQALNKNRQAKFRASRKGESPNGNGVTSALPFQRTVNVTPPSRGIPDPQSPIPDPQPPIQDPHSTDPGASTVRSQAARTDVRKREQRPRGRPVPASVIPLSATQRHELAHAPAADDNYAVLERLTHEVMDRCHSDDPTSADVIEGVKVDAATRGIAYPPDVLTRALSSVGHQRTHVATVVDNLRAIASQAQRRERMRRQ